MSQHGLFYHPCPAQESINITTYMVVARMDKSMLFVRRQLNPMHADTGYDISDLFNKAERKLCKNVDRRVRMIMEAIRQLTDNGVLKFSEENDRRDLVLTLGENAPEKAPQLNTQPAAPPKRDSGHRPPASSRNRQYVNRQLAAAGR